MVRVLATCLVGILLTMQSPVLAKQSGENIARQVCSVISADNLKALDNIIDRHNLRLRNLYNGVRCNGYSILQFAVTAEAIDVGLQLTQRLPEQALANDSVNGQHLVTWANRTGYGSSPVVEAVRQRLEL